MDEHIRELLRIISRDDDQRSFRRLFDHYYPKLLNYSLYFLESKTAADEVLDQVFIGVWNNRGHLTKIEKFDSYIFRAVRNKCLNFLRDTQRIEYESVEGNDVKLSKNVRSPESHMINKELRMAILKAMDELPPRCRLVFELVKQDGFKYKEVAKLLDVSVNTVENQMGRAMSLMREKLSYLSLPAKMKKASSDS